MQTGHTASVPRRGRRQSLRAPWCGTRVRAPCAARIHRITCGELTCFLPAGAARVTGRRLRSLARWQMPGARCGDSNWRRRRRHKVSTPPAFPDDQSGVRAARGGERHMAGRIASGLAPGHVVIADHGRWRRWRMRPSHVSWVLGGPLRRTAGEKKRRLAFLAANARRPAGADRHSHVCRPLPSRFCLCLSAQPSVRIRQSVRFCFPHTYEHTRGD